MLCTCHVIGYDTGAGAAVGVDLGAKIGVKVGTELLLSVDGDTLAASGLVITGRDGGDIE